MPPLRRLVMALFAALPGVARAQTVPPPDGVYLARYFESPGAGRFLVALGSATGYAAPRRRVGPSRQWLYSVSNANDRYRYEVAFRAAACDPMPIVVAGGRIIAASGISTVGWRCRAMFDVDRAVADALVRSLGAARRDRATAGERVQGSLAITSNVFHAGAAIAVRAVLTNPADAPRVQFQAGAIGSFHMRVFRADDRGAAIELPQIPLSIRTGPTTFVAIEPGSSAELWEYVHTWADVTAPGHYRVDCTFNAVLAPDGANPFEDDAHRVWEREFTGTVEFDVVP